MCRKGHSVIVPASGVLVNDSVADGVKSQQNRE